MVEKIKYFFSIQRTRVLFFKNLVEPIRVLELGCGHNGNYDILHKVFPKAEYHGVDIFEKEEVIDNIKYKKTDLNKDLLPYPDGNFDLIIFTHVIEHLNNLPLLGSEINRVLNSKGSIYIETPNWTTILIPSFGFKRDQHYPFNFFDDPTHIKPWTKNGLYEFVFNSCKLKILKVGTARNWPRLPFDFFLILFGVIAGNRWRILSSFWNIYGWCIYITGTKNSEK